MNKPKPVTLNEVGEEIDSIAMQIRLSNPGGKWQKALADKLMQIKTKFALMDAYIDELRSELDKK